MTTGRINQITTFRRRSRSRCDKRQTPFLVLHAFLRKKTLPLVFDYRFAGATRHKERHRRAPASVATIVAQVPDLCFDYLCPPSKRRTLTTYRTATDHIQRTHTASSSALIVCHTVACSRLLLTYILRISVSGPRTTLCTFFFTRAKSRRHFFSFSSRARTRRFLPSRTFFLFFIVRSHNSASKKLPSTHCRTSEIALAVTKRTRQRLFSAHLAFRSFK